MRNERTIREMTEELQSEFRAFQADRWDQIPDIDLYKDQVISYMKRQHLGFELSADEALTPAMINNYIKSGLLPRARGKRYTRDHLAYLTAICLLKQVLSVSETGELLENEMRQKETGDFYERYSELLEREYGRTADLLDGIRSREQAADLALELAVMSYAEKLLCRQIIRLIAEDSETEQTTTE